MRPEFGAVAGAILVFAFFAIVAGDRGFLAARGVSSWLEISAQLGILAIAAALLMIGGEVDLSIGSMIGAAGMVLRSEEHTSELQSRGHLVCRLLREKKKN